MGSDFEKSIDEATARIYLKLKKNMEKACLLVEGGAKTECPVDEGLLRASISSEVKADTNAIVGYIGTNIDYAPYVHEGTGIYALNGNGRKTPWVWQGFSRKWRGFHYTKGQKPKPFLKNSVDKNKSRIDRILGE